ncbi:hypothetical protein VIGAN_04364100 [Vigna angularis var. angularis]|uniref:Uncharacterized protein n=1 Tax=Vigna angularis var. angularis TaxID=157739 RepID=A0A0S3RZL7_PHAAN|nr:hypothetical protein VIGAN_04364100 [Vigna angularis var. angularis]
MLAYTYTWDSGPFSALYYFSLFILPLLFIYSIRLYLGLGLGQSILSSFSTSSYSSFSDSFFFFFVFQVFYFIAC